MSSAFTIRDYTPEDYPALAALWETTGQRGFTEAEIDRLLRIEGRVLVAEGQSPSGEASQVVGVALWTHNGQSAFLWRVAVAPEFRGRGVGSALVSQAEREARESGFFAFSFHIHVTNERGKAMYRRLGFASRTEVEYWGKRLRQEATE